MTFSIEGIEEETGDSLPCPDCGLSNYDNRVKPGASPMDCSCMGYGGPEQMPVPQFELNVANVNGADLLRHLGLPAECYGEADPQDILTALALRHGSNDLLESEDRSEGNVHECGRSADQVARYMAKLEKIAVKAAKYDRKVIWG